MRKAQGILAMLFVCLLVVSSFGQERTGTTLIAREIVDGPVPSEVREALIEPSADAYVTAINFHGVSVQLGVLQTLLQEFPVEGGSYIALSSGRVADIPGEATTFISTNVQGVDIPGGSPDGIDAYDVATLTVTLDLTALTSTDKPILRFYFKFMTEEVPTFVGSVFQDFFTVFVYDAEGNLVENIARLPDGSPFTIDNAWPLMNQVGGSSEDPLPPYPNPNDVNFNGCTDIRAVEFDLSGLAGQVCTIVFQLGDAGDEIYDSAVFLDGFAISTEGQEPGENQIELGPLTIYANKIDEIDYGRYRLTGNVNIDGYLWFEGPIEVNTLTKVVTGTCKVRFSSGKALNIYLTDVETTFYIDASVDPPEFRFATGFQELGFKVAGIALVARDFKIFVNHPTYGFGIEGDVGLKIAHMKGGGPQGTIEAKGLYISSLLGIGFSSASIEAQNVGLGGGFKLEYLKLVYQPPTDTFSMEATLCVPYWHGTCFDGGITLVDGALDSVSLGFEHSIGIIIIPLPPPPNGIYLQRLAGSLGELATGNPTIGAELGMTLGPEEEFAGHTFHLLRFNITGTIGNGFLQASGTVTVFWEGGEFTSASVTWEQARGVILEGSLDLFGILAGMLRARVDNVDGKLRAFGILTAQMPDWVPLVGNRQFPSVKAAWVDWDFGFEVRVQGGWGPFEWDIPISLLITPNPDSPYCKACLFVLTIPLTDVKIGAGCNLTPLFEAAKSPSALCALMAAKALYEETFYVPEGEPFIIARVEAGPGITPYLELVDPNGLVITPEYAQSHPEDFIVRTNTTLGELWIGVREPMAGAWTLRLPEAQNKSWLATAKQDVSFQVLGGIPAPMIDVTAPAVDVTTSDTVDIMWEAEAAVEGASVSLFYTPIQDEAGYLIAEGLPLTGSYTWDVRGTVPGTYWICAAVDDGHNTMRKSCAPGKVTITKDPPQAVLTAPQQVQVGEDVILDATSSSDPWNADLAYSWILLSAPAGSGAIIVPEPIPENAHLVPDLPGEYVVRLLVCDPYGMGDVTEVTITATAPPTSLVVPQIGNILFVGTEFTLLATVYDPTGNPAVGQPVYFEIVEGPHTGLSATFLTDLSGKAAFTYTGVAEGIDTIRVWTGADEFDQAPENLRATRGVVWLHEDEEDVCSTLCTAFETPAWHMVALPGELCPPCVYDGCGDVTCALCDDLDPCYIFYYDPDQRSYVMAPPKENICYHQGMGFWVRTYEPDVQVCVDVEVPTEDVAVPLAAAWNMIGNPFPFDVAVSGLRVRYQDQELSLLEAQAQGWVSAYLFGYDSVNGGYVVLDPEEGILEAWHGYWLRAYVECELIVPAEPASSAPPAGALSPQDIERLGIEPPPPPNLPSLAGELRVLPIPNPVRDVNTPTFRVLGICPCSVQALRVEIYDTAGNLVWEDEVQGAELAWHTENLDGLPLANGVYLYKAYVKVNDEWIPAGVQKVAIFR